MVGAQGGAGSTSLSGVPGAFPLYMCHSEGPGPVSNPRAECAASEGGEGIPENPYPAPAGARLEHEQPEKGEEGAEPSRVGLEQAWPPPRGSRSPPLSLPLTPTPFALSGSPLPRPPRRSARPAWPSPPPPATPVRAPRLALPSPARHAGPRAPPGPHPPRALPSVFRSRGSEDSEGSRSRPAFAPAQFGKEAAGCRIPPERFARAAPDRPGARYLSLIPVTASGRGRRPSSAPLRTPPAPWAGSLPSFFLRPALSVSFVLATAVPVLSCPPLGKDTGQNEEVGSSACPVLDCRELADLNWVPSDFGQLAQTASHPLQAALRSAADLTEFGYICTNGECLLQCLFC
ncbi:uncharacterized protein [Notamacropus eugenii]|uniref:uncharacterized protein n=1 Tax=Notamacropus eugenii TaxID=9315 RepID=UPI003B67E3FD